HPYFFFAFPWGFLLFALAFFLAFALAQPVTLIGVDWWITAPSCPVNAVGIVSFVLQRFPFAASAEYLPCGRFSSKLAIGTSGTFLNVLLVILVLLLMNVEPTRSTVTP